MNAKRIVRIEDYEQYIGAQTVDRIKKKASRHRIFMWFTLIPPIMAAVWPGFLDR